MEAGVPLCLIFLTVDNPWGASGWEGRSWVSFLQVLASSGHLDQLLLPWFS